VSPYAGGTREPGPYRVASVLRPIVLMVRSQGQRVTLSVATGTYAKGRSDVMGQVIGDVIGQISPEANRGAVDIKAAVANGFVIVTVYRRGFDATPLAAQAPSAVVGGASFTDGTVGGPDLESSGRRAVDEGGWLVAGPRPDGGYTVTLAFPAADQAPSTRGEHQVYFATGA
jgi:hypothetical protein